MKTFNELKIGDNIYYIDVRTKVMYVSEIYKIETYVNELIFDLHPVVGPKTQLRISFSKDDAFAVTEKSLIFTSEVAFSIFKEFVKFDENV